MRKLNNAAERRNRTDPAAIDRRKPPAGPYLLDPASPRGLTPTRIFSGTTPTDSLRADSGHGALALTAQRRTSRLHLSECPDRHFDFIVHTSSRRRALPSSPRSLWGSRRFEPIPDRLRSCLLRAALCRCVEALTSLPSGVCPSAVVHSSAHAAVLRGCATLADLAGRA